jgi:hypothetical protein
MPFTTAQATTRLRALGRDRVDAVMEVAGEGQPDLIHGGHGRGWLQIDDRFHQEWLRSRPGCADGTWAPFKFSVHNGGALPAGRVPGMVAAEQYAIRLLNANASFGAARGVRASHLKPFMLAAYNCGAGNALRAYQRYGIAGIDRFTANGDYSADVLLNQASVRAALDVLGW